MPFCKYCRNSTATYSKRLHTFVVGCSVKKCEFISTVGAKDEQGNEQQNVSNMVQHESAVLQAKPQQVQSIWRQGN